jgi:plasmid stabilization system protein ParE
VKYWLHPEALVDLREAAEFYREQAGLPLSRAFLSEFEYSIELLCKHPGLGGAWRHGTRRFSTRRFPFSVIYTVVDSELRVLAVAHQSRRPGYWLRRK